MAFDFSCPQCKHIMQMDNSAAGELGVCAKCDAEVLIKRGTMDSEAEEGQTEQEEELSETPSASDPSGTVVLSTGTTVITRMVVALVFLCVVGGGGYLIYNNIVEFFENWENNGPTGWTDHQKKLIQQTETKDGRPDYSHLAVEQPEPTEEEKRIGEAMGAVGGGFGDAPTSGGEGENQRGQGSGRRSFDPEQIFADRDKDMDGLLTGAEISERMQSRMGQVDTDKDGAISKEEFVTAMAALMAAGRQGGSGGQRGGPQRGGDDTERPELQDGQP